MSCRPRIPNERGLYGYPDLEHGFEPPGAPRLQGTGITSKIAISAVILCCFSVFLLAIVFIGAAILSLPTTTSYSATAPGTAVVSIDQRVPVHKRRGAQRSVLKKLALLRRAPAPAHGVDHASVLTVFPDWIESDGRWHLQNAIEDVALALSYLAQEDEPLRDEA